MVEKGFYEKEDYWNLMRYAFDNSCIGYIIANKEGQYIKTNKAHEKITGYSEDMIKEINSKYMEKDFSENKISSTKLVLKKKKEVLINQHHRSTDKNILIRGIPYFDEEGEVEYVLSELFDVDKFVQLQRNEALKGSGENKGYYEKVVTNKSILEEESTDFIVYKSKIMSDIMEKARIVANSDVTTLILGESGTGKELLAKYIHRKSLRKDKPFVKINCSALPENLLESELFGYEPGSFTGGISSGKEGLLEYANKGTILLDEIGDMALNLQSKILRFLQEKEIMRIGGKQPIKVDVRVIASTNVDLADLINEKKFREDLYYRLSVMPIKLPPLRERKEDIPLLIHYFLKHFNYKHGKNKNLDENLIKVIVRESFHGNIRQLSNLMERLVIMSPKKVITVDDFNNMNFEEDKINRNIDKDSIGEGSLEDIINSYERKVLKKYKDKYKSTYKIAEKLKVNQSTISRKMNKYGL